MVRLGASTCFRCSPTPPHVEPASKNAHASTRAHAILHIISVIKPNREPRRNPSGIKGVQSSTSSLAANSSSRRRVLLSPEVSASCKNTCAADASRERIIALTGPTDAGAMEIDR